MSTVRHMDRSPVHPTRPGRQEEAVSMCKRTQILDGRDHPWPFMYSYKKGGCVVNTAPRKSAYAQAQDVGDALI